MSCKWVYLQVFLKKTVFCNQIYKPKGKTEKFSNKGTLERDCPINHRVPPSPPPTCLWYIPSSLCRHSFHAVQESIAAHGTAAMATWPLSPPPQVLFPMHTKAHWGEGEAGPASYKCLRCRHYHGYTTLIKLFICKELQTNTEVAKTLQLNSHILFT